MGETQPILCFACRWLDVQPVASAVDQFGVSKDEADGLCVTHRARMTEGYCVLCGRRAPWFTFDAESDAGPCRPCFVARYGEAQAAWVEDHWAAIDRASEL